MVKISSDRESIERHIREERERLYGVMIQAPAMIGVVRGPDFVFELANPLYLKVVGKTDDIIGKPLLTVMPELKGQPILKVLRQVYRTGEPYFGNEMLIPLDMDNDGEPEDIYFDFVYQPLKDADGRTDGIMTHAMDVTEQVLAKRKVAESEDRYRGLFNAIDEGFCLIELIFDEKGRPLDYRFLETNKVFESQTGLQHAVGKTVRELVPNIEQRWIDMYSKVALTGRPMRFKDQSEAMGRVFDVHASRLGGPKSRRVALLFTDITGREQAEHSRESARRQVTEVLESMGDACFILDKDWNIILVNKVHEKVTKTKRKEILGKNFWEVFPVDPSLTSKYWIEHHKVMETRKASHFLEYYEPLNLWTETDVYPTQEGGISVFFRDVSARIQAEKATKESEERFRSMADNIPNLAWMAKTDGYIYWYNSRWYEYTGKTPSDMEGWGWQSVHDPEILPEVLKEWQKSIASGQPFDMTFPIKGVDGTFRSFLTRVMPVKDDDGKIMHWFGTNTDVTEQREMAEALNQSEQRFRTLIEQSADVIQLVTAEGKVLYSSDSIKQILGYDPADIQGVVVAPYIYPEDREFFGKVWGEVLAAPGNQRTVEYRVKHANGEWVWIESTITNHVETVNINAVVGNFRQITKRKQAEAALKASEEQLRFMAESMPQKVFTADPDGVVDYYNPQWTAYTGLSVQALILEGWKEFIHPDEADNNVRAWNHAVATGEPFEIEHRFRGKDGKYHWHISRANAMRNAQGKIIKWMGSSTDVEAVKRTLTRKKQLEQTTANLREQRAQLVALNEAKDEFISLASHQLRTPATGVKQYLGMVLDEFAGEVPTAQRRMLEQANLSNERQITIINDLLKVAQVDAGKVKLKKQPTDLANLLREIIADQQSKFDAREQAVKLVIPAQKLQVEMDSARMRMVLENLIDNASKYTPVGKNIEVRLAKSGEKISIAIRDEGVGIPQEDIDKLFLKFSRLENPLSVSVGGTGLGLYWAKKIVDLHGGEINVHSVPDEGSTFTVTLPA